MPTWPELSAIRNSPPTGPGGQLRAAHCCLIPDRLYLRGLPRPTTTMPSPPPLEDGDFVTRQRAESDRLLSTLDVGSELLLLTREVGRSLRIELQAVRKPPVVQLVISYPCSKIKPPDTVWKLE